MSIWESLGVYMGVTGYLYGSHLVPHERISFIGIHFDSRIQGVYMGVTGCLYGSHWVSIWESLGVYAGVTGSQSVSIGESLGASRCLYGSHSVSIWDSLNFLFLSITMKNQMADNECVSYPPNIVH